MKLGRYKKLEDFELDEEVELLAPKSERNSPLKAVVDGRVLYGVMSATCWSRPKPTRQARPSQ